MVFYKSWLGVSFWNITIAKEEEIEVKEVRELLCNKKEGSEPA